MRPGKVDEIVSFIPWHERQGAYFPACIICLFHHSWVDKYNDDERLTNCCVDLRARYCNLSRVKWLSSRRREQKDGASKSPHVLLQFTFICVSLSILSTCNLCLFKKRKGCVSSGCYGFKHQTAWDLLWFESHVAALALTWTRKKSQAWQWFLGAIPTPPPTEAGNWDSTYSSMFLWGGCLGSGSPLHTWKQDVEKRWQEMGHKDGEKREGERTVQKKKKLNEEVLIASENRVGNQCVAQRAEVLTLVQPEPEAPWWKEK